MRPFRLLVLLVSTVLALGCDDQGGRKIKLATSALPLRGDLTSGSSVVRVAAEEQRSIGIITFENQTGDESLEWLRRGLTDMLTAELSQSPYLKVFGPGRLDGILQRVGRTAGNLRDDAVAARVISEANVDSFLVGRFRTDDVELVIDAELREVASGQSLRKVEVRGPRSLERVFMMVADLSKQVREDLRGDLTEARDRGLRIGEMTTSVEAYRHYSSGLANREKLLHAEAQRDFALAVAADPTFAAAWLRSAEVCDGLGDRENAKQSLALARQHAARLTRADEILLRFTEAAWSHQIEAIPPILDELLSAAPVDIDARMNAAGTLFRLREYDRALSEYEALVELDPTRKLPYNQLAYINAFRGDFASARRDLERYRERSPDEPNAYDSTGEILMMEGRLREAVEMYEQALVRWPAFWSSLRALSALYGELGDRDKSLDYADRTIAASPSPYFRGQAHLLKALQLWRYDRRTEAHAELAMARESAPGRIEANRVEANFARAVGDTRRSDQLERATFAMLQEIVKVQGLASDDGITLLVEALNPLIPAEELADLMADVDRELATTGDDRLRILRPLLLLKLGRPELAEAMFDQTTQQAFRNFATFEEPRRRSAWKHFDRAIDLAWSEGAAGLSAAERFLSTLALIKRGPSALQVRLLELGLRHREGRNDVVAEGYAALGMPQESLWRLIGPFEDRGGFEYRYPPEVVGVDPNSSYEAAGESRRWQGAEDGRLDGFVDMAAVLAATVWGVGYAAIDIESDVDRTVQIRLGSDESCKLWLNKELVWQAYRDKPAELDSDIVKVHLRAGVNTVLLKVLNRFDDWGFQLRVTRDDGRGVSGIGFRAISTPLQARGAAEGASPR